MQRTGASRRWIALLLLTAALAPPAAAQEEAVPPAELKKLSIEELMEIDVTSVSRRSERLSRAAAAVTVITGEDIRRSGATTLVEALRLINSVQMAQADARTWATTTRGFNITTANKLLVLIDGRSVYTPLFSGVFWDVQHVFLEDVDRIEIIRGPGATLWGANAVNGVINVITKSARATEGGVAKAGGGEGMERAFGGARYGGRIGERTYYRAYADTFYRDALELANGESAEDPLRLGQVGFRVDGDASSRDAFTVQGDFYQGSGGRLVRDDVEMDGGNLLGRWTRSLSEESNLELQVYWDRTHRDIPGTFEEDLDTWDVDFQHQFPLAERHRIVWGLGYRFFSSDVVNSREVAWVPEDRDQALFSAFVQDEISLHRDELRLTIGSKLENNESTGLEVQPSVRMAWTPTDRRTLWAAISRAVRTPTRIDEDVRFLLPDGSVLLAGNRDFDSEKLLAYELGYRILLRPELLLDVATFYNVYDDLRSQERPADGSPIPITLANELEAETWGAEVRLNYEAAPWWRIHAAYAWFEKDLELDPGSTDPTGGRPEGNDPEGRALLRSSFDLPGNVQVDGQLRYVSRLPSPVVPAYTELDLRIGWSPIPRLDLSLLGRNLLHASHPEFGAPSPLREEVRRSVYGRVTWRF
ncbi:MAG TPA: TonB-dependent receptor [Thermoanaerobaculia bacterium]|nr:TonB-dependent receptor [Thermoanaerobaculia bacterium]